MAGLIRTGTMVAVRPGVSSASSLSSSLRKTASWNNRYRSIQSRCNWRTTTTMKCSAFSTSNDGNDTNGVGVDDSDPAFFDVLIVGGGVVGCSLARLLNATIPTLSVGLLEARDFTPPAPGGRGDDKNNSNEKKMVPNPRSYALSPKSLQILGETTQLQLQQQLGYYTSMQVWQAHSPASLTFSTRDLNADPLKAPYLGAVVEDAPLVASLWHQIQNQTTCFTDTKLTSIKRHLGGTTNDSYEGTSTTATDGDSLVTVTTNQGVTMETSLLVGADGGNSWVRQTSGISRMGTEYNQHALTFTVELSASNHQRAFQRFLPDGSILALLPTHSSKFGVVVWSTSPSIVRQWKEEDDSTALIHHLNELLMQGPQRVPPLLEREEESSPSSSSSTIVSNLLYGAERVLDTVHYGMAMASHHPNPKFMVPPKINSVVSPKFSFPLSCYQAQSYTTYGNRIALVGDAAHTTHPMAGQGLNLGLGDVQVLVDCIQKAAEAGMDVSTFVKDDYGINRHRSISISLAGIHSLQRLFGNQQDTALQHAKTLGLNVLQNVAPLRRQLVQAAAYGI